MLKPTLLALALLTASFTAALAADPFTYLTDGQAKAGVAKAPPDGKPAITYLVRQDGVFIDEVVRRFQSGEVEFHDHMNDYIVILEGKASFLVGGTMQGKHQIGPGEWRAPSVTGGKSYDLHPGVMINIPPGTPHQVILPKGGHLYYVTFKRKI